MNANAWAGSLAGLLLLAHGLSCGDTEPGDGGSGGTGATGTAGQGGGGAAGGGAGGNLAEEYCLGDIARDERCGETPATLEECLAGSSTSCLFDLVRPEIIQELITCLNERACGEVDDACLFDVGAQDPTAGQQEFLSACNAKLTACQGNLNDDYCQVTATTTARYASMTACLELECALVPDCIIGTFPASCQ